MCYRKVLLNLRPIIEISCRAGWLKQKTPPLETAEAKLGWRKLLESKLGSEVAGKFTLTHSHLCNKHGEGGRLAGF